MENEVIKYNQPAGEIVLYQPDNTIELPVMVENETVWLTQTQLVMLYQSSKANISEHIKHIFAEGELDKNSYMGFESHKELFVKWLQHNIFYRSIVKRPRKETFCFF